MALCEKILLVGFSGSGKSTFLRELQNSSPGSWDVFSDLDQIILKKYGSGKKVLADLIESVGWETFRKWESEEIVHWLAQDHKGVLALGGGSLTQGLLDFYAPSPKVAFCYLYSPFETCIKRLEADADEPRPLLQRGRGELEKIYRERQEIFDQVPWKISNLEASSPALLATEFWSKVCVS